MGGHHHIRLSVGCDVLQDVVQAPARDRQHTFTLLLFVTTLQMLFLWCGNKQANNMSLDSLGLQLNTVFSSEHVNGAGLRPQNVRKHGRCLTVTASLLRSADASALMCVHFITSSVFWNRTPRCAVEHQAHLVSSLGLCLPQNLIDGSGVAFAHFVQNILISTGQFLWACFNLRISENNTKSQEAA